MSEFAQRTYIRVTTPRPESGEGVFSTAFAVLVMAALGAAFWLAAKAIWGGK